MIDPQSQANQWIRSLEQENKLTILKFGDREFNLNLETAIRNGYPALLENISEYIDASLDFLLGKQLFKHSKNWCHNLELAGCTFFSKAYCHIMRC